MDFVTLTFIFLHAMAALIWVGGIFFAYVIIRPVSLSLEPPMRLQLWVDIYQKFFKWVWLAIGLLVISGYVIWSLQLGGMANAAPYMKAMHGVGWLMIALFAWLFFVAYKKFKDAVFAKDFPEAALIMSRQIRPIMVINLWLGILEVLIGATGRYW